MRFTQAASLESRELLDKARAKSAHPQAGTLLIARSQLSPGASSANLDSRSGVPRTALRVAAVGVDLGRVFARQGIVTTFHGRGRRALDGYARPN